ncbi:MAG: RsmB/NOP family class I SAM-dependent RNA methyltransferase [Holosporaceae bacterium]|jgi:16S rRNA (cytosine967-C5)-methyltransferase|nr:RsmB/NOP family class I SAM-dependent RNA methyltransferase [Holosporaceae bacterium]
MQLTARVQITAEMLDLFFESGAPFDVLMAKFFKNNKWIGASDRREIAEFSYAIFRSFEKLKFLTSNITANFGRFYVLAFLVTERKLSPEKISEIFNGKRYAPAALTNFEMEFVGVLQKKVDFPANALLNYPQWMTPLLERAFSPGDLANELLALNERAPLDLRVNTLKSCREVVKKMLMNSGFQVEDCRYSSDGLRLPEGRIGRNHDVIKTGLAEIQDQGSQLVAEMCVVSPLETLVDFCAGAGGKTLAIAAAMGNRGRIFALDKEGNRLKKAQLRFRRAGLSNVFCQEITSKWIKRHRECADVVLVDAPCSGTGSWRRNPDMRAKFTPKDLEELLIVQAEILESAQRLVKKGGRLIYATCSILKEENQDQVKKFLEKFPKFKLGSIKLQNYSGEFLQLTPHKNQTDGFFGAILEFT